MNKGFTLVELSIVLVIIGLLIGGILVAQSMIGTAKMLKVIGTASQFQIATTQFKDRTHYLPGDAGASAGMPAGIRGDQNKMVSNYENRSVLGHLVLLNMFSSNQDPSFFTTNCLPGPSSVLIDCWIQGYHQGYGQPSAAGHHGKANYKLSTVTDDGSGGMSPFPGVVPQPASNSMRIGDLFITYGAGNIQSNTSQHIGGLLTPLDAMTIDKKLDDGIATTGAVIGHPGGNNSCVWPGCNCIDDGDTRDANIQNGQNYLLSHKQADCVVMFRIGSYSDITPGNF